MKPLTARARVLPLLAALGVLAVAAVPVAAARSQATYRVTIENLSDGQPLTPPLVALHRGSVGVFQVGLPASFGVKEIAENGNLGPLMTSLTGTRGVGAVYAGAAPLVPTGSPGDAMFDSSTSFTLSAARDARFLSWVSMLVCTNDGFTGVSRLKLPSRIGGTVSATAAGYDAGTERNTEEFSDIVPPCRQGLIGVAGDAGTGMSDPSLAEGSVIHHHAGIQGGADLVPAIHGWSDPIARISITRIS